MKKKDRLKCRAKVARGNVFDSYAEADDVADMRGSYFGIFLKAYRCKVCKLYHIGSPWRYLIERLRARKGLPFDLNPFKQPPNADSP